MTVQSITPGLAADAATLPALELGRVLANALRFACPDTMLPVINAVAVELTGEQLVTRATDRYTLIRERVALETPGKGRVLLSVQDVRSLVDLVKLATRGLPKAVRAEVTAVLVVEDRGPFWPITGRKRAPVFDDSAQGGLRVEVGLFAAEFDGISGRVPDIDAIINAKVADDTAQDRHVALDPRKLDQFSGVNLGPDLRGRPFLYEMRGRMKPVRITCPDEPDRFVGMLMPVRLADVDGGAS